MHQFRRRAHRAAKLPRSGWRRVFRYHEETFYGGLIIRTVTSEDAPYEDQDAQFWDWMTAILVVTIIVGFAVWGISVVV